MKLNLCLKNYCNFLVAIEITLTVFPKKMQDYWNPVPKNLDVCIQFWFHVGMFDVGYGIRFWCKGLSRVEKLDHTDFH